MKLAFTEANMPDPVMLCEPYKIRCVAEDKRPGYEYRAECYQAYKRTPYEWPLLFGNYIDPNTPRYATLDEAKAACERDAQTVEESR